MLRNPCEPLKSNGFLWKYEIYFVCPAHFGIFKLQPLRRLLGFSSLRRRKGHLGNAVDLKKTNKLNESKQTRVPSSAWLGPSAASAYPTNADAWSESRKRSKSFWNFRSKLGWFNSQRKTEKEKTAQNARRILVLKWILQYLPLYTHIPSIHPSSAGRFENLHFILIGFRHIFY